MKLAHSRRFAKRFQTLIKENRGLVPQVEKTLRYLQSFPPAHPALRMKRMQGTDGVYECSVNMDIRITFEFLDSDTILLRYIDHHDDALKRY